MNFLEKSNSNLTDLLSRASSAESNTEVGVSSSIMRLDLLVVVRLGPTDSSVDDLASLSSESSDSLLDILLKSGSD